MANLKDGGGPRFDERQSQDTITSVPQSDGTIKYYLGNYDERGAVMTCRVMDGGLYKAGIIPTVQLIDDNGDDISNGGAEFNVIMSSKGECLEVTPKEGKLGTGLTPGAGGFIKAKLVTAAENVTAPAVVEVCVREGQWLDIPASEVQAHNEKVKEQWNSETSKLSADTNFQLPAATNKFGKIEGFSL